MLTLPLFPLNTVLFPGGRLPLRVFEKRYLDMVSACLRDDHSFGICLIASGREVGEAAEPCEIGTEAVIREWDMTRPGILDVVVQGGRRFRTLEAETAKDQLITARVEWLEDDLQSALLPQESDFADLCIQLLKTLNSDHYFGSAQPDNAIWVANRLGEWLPLPNREKQRLLESNDVHERLAQLRQLMQRYRLV